MPDNIFFFKFPKTEGGGKELPIVVAFLVGSQNGGIFQVVVSIQMDINSTLTIMTICDLAATMMNTLMTQE